MADRNDGGFLRDADTGALIVAGANGASLGASAAAAQIAAEAIARDEAIAAAVLGLGSGQWADTKIPAQLAQLLTKSAASTRTNLATNPKGGLSGAGTITTGSHAAGATPLNVVDASAFPASGSTLLGAMAISWTGKTATSLTGVTGITDTVPAGTGLGSLAGLSATTQGAGSTFETVTLGSGGAPAASAGMAALGLTKGFHHVTGTAGMGAGFSVAVTSGRSYQFTAYVRLASLTATSVRMLIQNAAGTNKYAGTAGTGGNITTTGAWATLVGSVTADATETWKFVPAAQNGSGAAERYWTGALIEYSTNRGVYFDGDSTDALWSGTANASTSESRSYGLDTVTATTAALLKGTAVGIELRQANVQSDGQRLMLHRQLTKDHFHTVWLEAEKLLPGGGNLVNRMTRQTIGMPMLSKPGFDGTASTDTSITLTGTWTGVSSSTRQYNGGHRRSNTSGSKATFVSPTGVTRIGLRCPIAGAGGFAKVSIDGDLTRANLLPTAQDLVDRGVMTTGQRDSLGATSRILDFDPYGHGNSTQQQDRMHIMFATDLDPTSAHTVYIEATGEKASWASDTYIYESGFSYDQPGIAVTQTGVEVLQYKGIWTNSSGALEYATRVHGGTTETTVGGIHGYETQTAFPTIYVDGKAVTLTEDAGVTWGQKLQVVRETTLQHPDFGGNIANVTTAYSFEDDGLHVDWKRTWLESVTLTFDDRMFMFDMWRYTKTRSNIDTADRTLVSPGPSPATDVDTPAAALPPITPNSVIVWEPTGDVVAGFSIPDIRKGLDSYSITGSGARIQERASVNGNSTGKWYFDRVSSTSNRTGAASDTVTAPRTDRSGHLYWADVIPSVDTREALT